MTYQKQNVIERNVMNSVMAFCSSAPIRLHSVSPSFLFLFLKHGGYAIFFQESKQTITTLSSAH
jgi:hypothetical protein